MHQQYFSERKKDSRRAQHLTGIETQDGKQNKGITHGQEQSSLNPNKDFLQPVGTAKDHLPG